MPEGKEQDARFWLSRKFWYVVIAAGIFLALALTGTLSFTAEQAIEVIKWLLGLAVGAHAVTDIASLVTGAIERKATTQSDAMVRAATVAAMPESESSRDSN